MVVGFPGHSHSRGMVHSLALPATSSLDAAHTGSWARNLLFIDHSNRSSHQCDIVVLEHENNQPVPASRTNSAPPSQLPRSSFLVPPALVTTLVHLAHLPPTATCLIASMQSPAWHSFHPAWLDTTASILPPILLYHGPPPAPESTPAPTEQAIAAQFELRSSLLGSFLSTTSTCGPREHLQLPDWYGDLHRHDQGLPLGGRLDGCEDHAAGHWPAMDIGPTILPSLTGSSTITCRYIRACGPRRRRTTSNGRPRPALGVLFHHVPFTRSMAGPAVGSSSAAS